MARYLLTALMCISECNFYRCLRMLSIRFAGSYLTFGKHPLDDSGKPACDFYRFAIRHEREVDSECVQIFLAIAWAEFIRAVQGVLRNPAHERPFTGMLIVTRAWPPATTGAR